MTARGPKVLQHSAPPRGFDLRGAPVSIGRLANMGKPPRVPSLISLYELMSSRDDGRESFMKSSPTSTAAGTRPAAPKMDIGVGSLTFTVNERLPNPISIFGTHPEEIVLRISLNMMISHTIFRKPSCSAVRLFREIL